MQLLARTDAHCNAYRGVLMPDPMRPYICFELSSKTTVKKPQVKLPADEADLPGASRRQLQVLQGLELRMAGMASRLGNPWAAAACPDDRATSNPTGWRTDADLEGAMRSAAWRTMESMAATLRRSLLRGLCWLLIPDAVHETMSLCVVALPVRGRTHTSGKGTLMVVRVVFAQVRAPGSPMQHI